MKRSCRIHDIFLSALSGLLLLSAYPSISFSYAAFFAWVPLCIALEKKTFRKAFQLGWITGLIFFGFLIYWLNYVTVEGYTLVLLYLSLYPALFSGIYTRLKGPVVRPLWGALIWTLMEYLRSIGGWSFSWGLMGHSVESLNHLLQSTRMCGVYGLSFLIMASNLALAELWLAKRDRRRIRNHWLWPLAALLILALIGYGNERKEAKKPARTFRVSLIQGNYPQDDKWEESVQDVLDHYLQMSELALADQPELIIWPETAIPDILSSRDDLREQIEDWIRKYSVPLLLGTIMEEASEKSSSNEWGKLYNSACLVQKSFQGDILWDQYDKVHLVPYGERIPFQNLFPFLRKMVESRGGGEYYPGQSSRVFQIHGIRFGVLICFESTLAPLARKYALQDVDFLAVITNDAWFYRSTAPFQHALQSAYRATEFRVPVVRATNTGWTCAYDETGRLIDSIPIFEEGFLTVSLQLRRHPSTLYTRLGDLPMQLVLGLVLGFCMVRRLLPELSPSGGGAGGGSSRAQR